jgi:anaerobic selenocysteine-containing dehydrogenase
VLFAKPAAFGGNTQGKEGEGKGVSTGRHHSRVSQVPEVYGELPMSCMAEEIETAGEGQLRALITIGSNPVLSSPDGMRLSAAMEKLDFMVSLDIYLNETTRHADVILPGISPLEDFHYDVAFPQMSWRNHARVSNPIFERPEGQPEEWQSILKIIAITQGKSAKTDIHVLDDAAFEQDTRRMMGSLPANIVTASAHLRGPRRLLDLALRMGPYDLNLAKVEAANALGGIDLGELQPRIPNMLRTPSGKVELAPVEVIQDLQRALRNLHGLRPDLVIIGRRDVRTNNSWMHNLPTLAKGPFRCTALVHPQDAAQRGVTDGSTVTLRNGSRNIQAIVHVSEDMMQGVVSLPHGWGHNAQGAQLTVAAERPGTNINALLDPNLRDPLSGNSVLGGIPITMELAELQ